MNSLPTTLIFTWEELAQKFLAKFYSLSNIVKMRIDINNFTQYEGETLYDTWERFKEFLMKCPYHGMPNWMQVHNFYKCLGGPMRMVIDSIVGGTFMRKTKDAAYELLEELAMNNYQWPNERLVQKKPAGVYEVV